MKLSYKWLKEFIDIKLAPQEVASKITMAGTEVTSVRSLDKGIKKVITAQITSVNSHPNADKLSCCTVFTGKEELAIVCGAKNIKAQDKVPLAIVGAVLPGNKEINAAEIRGKKSFGMMCSERELGLSEDHGGIMILPSDTPLGLDINTVLELDDFILEVEPTPNRGDCLSVLGIARELAAVLGLKLKMPQPKVKETTDKVEKYITVEVKDTELCKRYAARYLSQVKISTSPLWLQNRLRNCGLRPINNVVDITNYVLLELGQPLHAFDYVALAEKKIVVRTAQEAEEIVTLDGMVRKLPKNTLVIADAKKPVALAGIMGGQSSGINENTRELILESAYFDPVSIRKTARSLALNSEAGYRFERGVDVENVMVALERVTQLLQDTTGAQPAKGVYDVYPHKIKQPKITLRQVRLNKILGTNITFAQTKKILKSLGFNFTENINTETFNVVVSPWRNDIEREIDLIEEVARIYGYEEIPATLPKGSTVKISESKERIVSNLTATTLCAAGFSEIISYSFIGEKDYRKVGVNPEDQPLVRVANPLTAEATIMRTTLFCSLLNNVAWNVNRGQSNIKIFEQSRVFHCQGKNTFAEEVKMLAMAVTGLTVSPAWNRNTKVVDIFYLKGIADELMNVLNLRNYRYQPSENSFFAPGLTLDLLINERLVATFGKVSSAVEEAYDLTQAIYYGEFNLQALNDLYTGEKKYSPISKYPGIRRDLSLLLEDEITNEQVLGALRQEANHLVKEINLFDVYQGEGLEPGFKSYAYSFLYQADDRTLQDEEVSQLHRLLVEKVTAKLGAKVR